MSNSDPLTTLATSPREQKAIQGERQWGNGVDRANAE